MATCEIISVGTEILLGDILNTDAQFLSRQLASLGISVLFQTTVGDNAERLISALKIAAGRSDIIITSGGLGPTPDDLTKEICCEFFGKECFYDEESISRMSAYFAQKGLEMPESNKKQAFLPKDGVIFKNDNGTAPGCAIEKDGTHIIMLPGPPGELKPMFLDYALDYLKQFSSDVILSHQIRTFGIGESAMAQKVSGLLGGSNPTAAPYAKDGEALLRVTAKAESEEKAEEMMKPVIEKIYALLDGYIYGTDVENIETAVVKKLKEKSLVLAAAESCTGGYISKRITDVPGSSDVFECGIVSYANSVKAKLLGVSEENLEKYGAVSEPVAKEMALGALKVSGANVAVGVTGIAGPGSDSTNKPVGLSFIALAADDGTLFVKKLLTGKSGKNCREYNRYVNASNALNLVRLYLDGKLNSGE
ncbi:MAG: competence/damage-inducible protein A [Clostridia bacterium]|nr:competence/damage-inducible protein A [Clostridia bacterium]